MKQPIASRVILVLLFYTLCLTFTACTESGTSDLGVYQYPQSNTAVTCESGSRTSPAGTTNGERTARDIRYNVRTPINYDPKIAHPLLMVYAPAGLSAAASERFTGLTKIATSAGFVVVYPDHVRNSIPVIKELSTIPGLVAKKWCIDETRVYLTGHSDGGTVAFAIAILEETKPIPAAIAPSAAGFTKADLAEFKCRAPLPVMILHSAKDALFPGFGAEAAAWWAACNQCDPNPGRPGDNGCVAYPNCADGVTTLYCEGTEDHAKWPSLNPSLIKFFSSGTRS